MNWTRMALSLAWLLPMTAGATVMVRLGLNDLADRAEVVVRGQVLKQESRWTKDGRRIVTEVQISVLEALKGSPGKTVTVLQPGGSVGSIGQKVSGVAAFHPADHVVVFLERRGENRTHFDLVGMGQGKWTVEEKSGVRRVVPEPTDATLIDAQTGQEVKPSAEPLPWEDLQKAVKRSMGRAP